MKKMILAGFFIIGVGLGYAYAENKATTGLAYQNKIETDAYSIFDNMCVMKITSKYESRNN